MNTVAKTLIAATAVAGTLGASTLTASAHHVPQPAPVVLSPAACDQYAKDYANWAIGHRGGQTVLGGAIGAGFGALVGGYFFGAPGLGAAFGGLAGAGAGAMWNNPQWQAEYQNAYNYCIHSF